MRVKKCKKYYNFKKIVIFFAIVNAVAQAYSRLWMSMTDKQPVSATMERIAPAVIEKIRRLMDEFTRSQRMLAEYIIQRPEKVGFLPINELAQAAGVSVATVIRFCNTMGYSGYVELGREIQISIQNE